MDKSELIARIQAKADGERARGEHMAYVKEDDVSYQVVQWDDAFYMLTVNDFTERVSIRLIPAANVLSTIRGMNAKAKEMIYI